MVGGNGNKAYGAAAAPRHSTTAPWVEGRRRWGGTWTRPAAQDGDWYVANGAKGVACPNCSCKKNYVGYQLCRLCGSSVTGKKNKGGGPNGPASPGGDALPDLEWPLLALPEAKGGKGGGKGKDKGGKGPGGGPAQNSKPYGPAVQGDPLPPGPLVIMDPKKAQDMADLARAAGDPVGEQRYLGLAAAAKAAQPVPPTTRQKLEKSELVQRDLEKKLQQNLDTLERWKKSRDALLERVADLKQQLDAAAQEHQQAVRDLQREYSPEAPKQPPKISIRELVEGRLELENILTMEDFLGTETAKEEYDLEAGDLEELNKRKDELSKQIQAGLATVFKGSLDKAKKAQEEQQNHLQRLEGKKRKTASGSTAGGGAGSAQPGGATDQAAPAAAQEPPPAAPGPLASAPSFHERLAAAMHEHQQLGL